MDMELDSSTSEQVSRLQLLYLFPRHHEFHRDEVIQLWMAHDLVPLLPPEDMELQLWFARESGLVPPSADIEFSAFFYFEEFEEVGVFQMSTLDYSVGQQRYKLSNSFVDLLAQNRSDEFFRVGDLNSHVSENTVHASFRDDDIDPLTLNELYKAERLLTLLILHRLGSHLAQIPRDLFLKLPLLRVLDLSYSSLTELPSSIGILKDLRYLNLSYTPITALPKSLCSLYKMQTLKLKGCLKLVGLPKGMRKLINLRHLEVDLDCLMVSMPPGLGDLAELRTLPAFVVGKEDGCHITELKNMINLCGTLSILRLENVSSSGEAKISALDNKKCLQNLELHWTDCVDGFQVLDNLLPHTRIKELQIVGYGGAEFPNWIGKPIFFNLATITISDCRNSELFPPLGNLPSLQYLSISDMHAVKQINSTFCGRNMTASLPGFPTLTPTHFRSDDMLRAFESLEKLTLNGMPMLETWNGIEAGDFPNLQKLSISQCPKLTSLPELSLLVYLQHLEISLCPLLDSFPSKGLPRLLRRLVIIDCPLLGVLSHKDDQKYWEKLAHISSIWIDYEQIIQRASGSIVAEIPISELISASMAEEKEETLDSGVNENKNEKENESVKLFVGQVPKHMTEAELLSMFKEVALVDEVNVIKDKATRASRGCCFVICPSRQEADKAVTACHNKRTLPGASSPLQVKYADGELERLEHKLFVGMLPKNVSDADVSDLFSKYGTVKDLQILRCSQQTSKGCAFLKYETKEQALAALEAINGKYKMEGSSVPLVVKWADTEKERQARRAQKAQSQAPSASTTDSGQQPSLFGAFPMGYMPPYNGFGYQAPGTYGLMQYPLPPMQNQPGFPNLIPPVNRANALRGISPDLRPGVAHKNFIPVPSAGFIGSAYPSAPGLQYPIPYPGRIMSPRPMTSSHVLSPPAIANSSPGTSPTAMTSSGAQVEGPPGANLFIYHIPQEFGDQELANAFQPFGRVLSAKVFVDKATGVSKCFGFVSYDSPAAAQSAINMMNGCQLGGKKLKVQLKRDNKQNKPY